ncbi:hypothetical protein SEVIR_1G291000v4 [Setaria viridis]|uniref:Uncharacterized protein n=1 Tax=Setaria viridis TaxID=4556 RepID=A0A4U6WEP2_SETVI|nr:uncharacterized protein LOC117843105 [Setaria viridis]TKW41092.1 hypothetical protein SEVIR_1G291000v2 [Setaria viridis]
MAMLRSALGRVFRRLSGPSAAPSMMSQRGAEILRSPTLPSLRPAELLVPHPEPAAQLMRTFMSPAATGTAARTRGVPNFQGWQHFPVGTEGVKCLQQKRFLSVERKETSKTRFLAWLRHFGPRIQLVLVYTVGMSSFVTMVTTFHRLDKASTKSNNFNSAKKRY